MQHEDEPQPSNQNKMSVQAYLGNTAQMIGAVQNLTFVSPLNSDEIHLRALIDTRRLKQIDGLQN
jgi:hypothetical protein